MSPFQVYGLEDADAWKLHVPVSAETDVYFSAGYHSIFRDRDEGEPRLFVYEDGADRAVFPFFLRSVPGTAYHDVSSVYGYGGFLISPESRGDEAFGRGFLSALDSHYREERVVAEFIRFHPLLGTHRFAPVDTSYIQPTITVDTTVSEDAIWSRYSSSNRRAVRKAERAGLELEIRDDMGDLDAFADLYRATMQRVGASSYYFFSNRFFRAHFEQLGGHAHLATVQKGGRIVAGALLLSWNGFLHYHLGASDADALALRPNNLLFHGVIGWARDRGFEQFHLGGGVRGEDSLYRFKKGFSQDGDQAFHVGRRVVDPGAYDTLVEEWRGSGADGAEVDEDYFPLYRARGSTGA